MKLTKIYGVNGDDYHNHRVVTFLFGTENVLFSKRLNYLLVVSKESPKSDTIDFEKDAYIEHLGDVDLKAIIDDSATNFILRCNPVKRNIKTRKLQPVFGEDNIKAWFDKRIIGSGFSLTGTILISESKSISMKNSETLTHHDVNIIGSLTVHDYDLFENAIFKGIGQAKFLGYGLINVFDSL